VGIVRALVITGISGNGTASGTAVNIMDPDTGAWEVTSLGTWKLHVLIVKTARSSNPHYHRSNWAFHCYHWSA
jgi:hypothetical protein